MAKLSLTNTYKKYPTYKDSGVEWVGNVPTGWDIATSRRLFKTKKELALETDSQKVLSLTLQGVIPRVLDGSGKNPANYDTYQEFQKDDLVFCLFDYDVTPRTIGYVGENGMMTGAYTRLIPKEETVSRFFYYYFLSLDYTKELLHLCTGLRNSISKPVFWSMKNPLPSKEEQEKIAKFLDEQTARIDETIAKKQRLIELLKEKRIATINHIVTKGLNRKVELSDSGIDWIGKLPKHWEIKRIKALAQVKRGASPRPIDDSKYFDENGEYSWVRISDVSSSRKYLTETEQRLSSLGSKQSVPLEPGELIVSIAATVGKPIINKIKCCIHDGFVYLKNLKLDPEFTFYVFDAGNAYKGLGKLGTQLNLNSKTIGNITIPIPPEKEQIEIGKILANYDNEFYDTVGKLENSLKLLIEFKSSLISHVVTGKIKV